MYLRPAKNDGSCILVIVHSVSSEKLVARHNQLLAFRSNGQPVETSQLSGGLSFWSLYQKTFGFSERAAVIHRNEPLSRGAGSKPQICAEMIGRGGETVMVSSQYSTGISLAEYQQLISINRNAATCLTWQCGDWVLLGGLWIVQAFVDLPEGHS
jgi:hypothetical protein